MKKNVVNSAISTFIIFTAFTFSLPKACFYRKYIFRLDIPLMVCILIMVCGRYMNTRKL